MTGEGNDRGQEERKHAKGKENNKKTIGEVLWPHFSPLSNKLLSICRPDSKLAPTHPTCTHPFSFTQKPTITLCQSYTHIHTSLFSHSNPRLNTHTHTQSNYSSQRKTRAPRPFYRRMEGERKKRLSFFSLRGQGASSLKMKA